MAEYYYTNNPPSEHEERHFTSAFMGRTLAFETDAGVFSKQHIDPGSEILCKSLPELHGRVLDMGLGVEDGKRSFSRNGKRCAAAGAMCRKTECRPRPSSPTALSASKASSTR